MQPDDEVYVGHMLDLVACDARTAERTVSNWREALHTSTRYPWVRSAL
jgi:hypothetical protein